MNADLARALADAADARDRLNRIVAPVSTTDMRIARPGGWTIGRVLEHVIESEVLYAKLLAHQCSKTAPDLDVSAPADGAAAVQQLTETRGTVEKMLDGMDDETLYRIVSFGREEYSPLSVIENVALHDREHADQIEALLSERQSPPRSAPTDLAKVSVRAATIDDLPRLTEIYNYYIINTPITFDLEPVTVEDRTPWFSQFDASGPHRIFVAEDSSGGITGYAGSHQFRDKRAYDTTVETTIYCAHDATGRGIGVALYTALFDAIQHEDIRMVVAGITFPNDASVRLHERFGFTKAGHMHGVGRKFDRYWDVLWMEKRLR